MSAAPTRGAGDGTGDGAANAGKDPGEDSGNDSGQGPREVVDADGLAWSCVEAFAGLSGASGIDPGKILAAAHVKGTDRVRVVCTPSGGARSVRLELPEDWREATSDEALLAAIDAGGGA